MMEQYVVDKEIALPHHSLPHVLVPGLMSSNTRLITTEGPRTSLPDDECAAERRKGGGIGLGALTITCEPFSALVVVV